jgi:hypothetical protein
VLDAGEEGALPPRAGEPGTLLLVSPDFNWRTEPSVSSGSSIMNFMIAGTIDACIKAWAGDSFSALHSM